MNKTQQMLEHLHNHELKDALRIAKTFRIGFSKEERAVIQRGYECLVHPSYYQQLGIDCANAIHKAEECLMHKYPETTDHEEGHSNA